MPLIVYELYLPPTRAAASTLEAALEAEPKGTFLAWSPGFGYAHWGSPYLHLQAGLTAEPSEPFGGLSAASGRHVNPDAPCP